MSRKTIETTIAGVKYRLTQLGGETISDLGFEFTEAIAFKSGLSGVLKRLRGKFAEATQVEIAGKWAPLTSLDGWWDDKPTDHGSWIAWTTEEGGLADFLVGTARALPPEILAQFKLLFRGGRVGGSTDSSSPKSSASPPAQT